MLRLSSSQTTSLLNQPESGMGYQSVEATTFDNKTKRATAFNAELLVVDDEPRSVLRTASFRKLVESAPSAAGEIRTLIVVRRSLSAKLQESLRLSESIKAKIEKTQPAKDAPEDKTKEGEVFKRFSAYANDNRLLPDGSWRDGTYATTEEDAKNVTTGTEAVARYALPNPDPASNVFTGKPKKDTVIQSGTVAPDFGQPGGGVEIICKNGTQPNTVTGPVKIPD